MALSPGSHLGPYEVLALIGAGGMGEVYRARDPRLDREVAIKVLPHDRVTDESRRQRFVQEAKAASALNHPHIVTIHEIESANGIDFIVMEYVRGKSLDALIPRQGMRLGEALRIAIAVADAMAAAHARGIVHRDLKPANVMVGADGAVKVLDFGLAKLRDTESTPDGETRTLLIDQGLSAPGTIAGTAAYMSPEQASGERVDARSDIFSFGAVLYELVTGVRAFAAPSLSETLSAVTRVEPTPPTGLVTTLPKELERVILRCLRKDRERRFQTIRDVSIELREIKEESDAGHMNAPVVSPQTRSRPTKLTILTATIAVALGVAAGWILLRNVNRASPPPTVMALTALRGEERHPTFSPDGEQVAFAWNGEKGDNWDIYLKVVGSSDQRRITTDLGDDIMPSWSPDGRQIAFVRETSSGVGVYVVSPIAGTERKLIATVGTLDDVSWSPNGQWLVITRNLAQPHSSVELLPSASGEFRPLLRDGTAQRHYSGGTISPDGTQLAVSSCANYFDCRLETMQLDANGTIAGSALVLMDHRAELGGTIAWTHDGQSVILDEQGTLWRVPINGGRTPDALNLGGSPGIYATNPAIASGRHRLAFEQRRSNVSIHTLDTTMTSPPILASSNSDFEPQFSPDGRQLAFASSRTGTIEIWVALADGTGARQLLHGPGVQQGSPHWSPDGHRIAFDSRGTDGHRVLYVVDAEGGVPQRLSTGAGNANFPVWSRDGQWIYFASDQKGAENIWRISLSGGNVQQITTTGSANGNLAISPDGREVFYNATGDPPGVLVAVPADGGRSPRQVLPCTKGFATTVTSLYYVECGPDTDHDVHAIDAKSGHDRVLGRTRDAPLLPLSVAPDDSVVLVPRRTVTSDLMLIENFR